MTRRVLVLVQYLSTVADITVASRWSHYTRPCSGASPIQAFSAPSISTQTLSALATSSPTSSSLRAASATPGCKITSWFRTSAKRSQARSRRVQDILRYMRTPTCSHSLCGTSSRRRGCTRRRLCCRYMARLRSCLCLSTLETAAIRTSSHGPFEVRPEHRSFIHRLTRDSLLAGIVEDPQVRDLFGNELTALREAFEVSGLLGSIIIS